MAAASLPDELLARVLSPVDLKSLVQARAVCKSWQTSVEGKQVSDLRATTVTGPFDILVTDDVRPWRNWLKQWWLTIHDENAMNYDHSTCVAVGDEIMVFGGSNEYHEKGDLETQLAFIRENDLGGMNDMLVDHVTRAYETEEYDHAWRVTLDPDGNVYEMAYDRAGARISEQSEGAAAVVVGL